MQLELRSTDPSVSFLKMEEHYEGVLFINFSKLSILWIMNFCHKNFATTVLIEMTWKSKLFISEVSRNESSTFSLRIEFRHELLQMPVLCSPLLNNYLKDSLFWSESTDAWTYANYTSNRMVWLQYIKLNQVKCSLMISYLLRIIDLVRTRNFPKNQHFLIPDTHTNVCISGGMTCYFFGKF